MRAVMEWSTFWHKFAVAGCGLRGREVARSLGRWVAGLRGLGVARSRGPQVSWPADNEDLTICNQPSNPATQQLGNPPTARPRNPETPRPETRETPSTQPPCISQRPSPYYVSHLSCDDLSKASRRAFQRMVFSALIVGYRPDSKVSNTQGCFMNSYDAR
jgi:hypothetical protein